MVTVQYELKFIPGAAIEIPSEYANKAATLVNLGLEGRTGLVKVVKEYFRSLNMGVMGRVMELSQTEAGTPESLRLQDIVYLRVCLQANESMLNITVKNDDIKLQQRERASQQRRLRREQQTPERALPSTNHRTRCGVSLTVIRDRSRPVAVESPAASSRETN